MFFIAGDLLDLFMIRKGKKVFKIYCCVEKMLFKAIPASRSWHYDQDSKFF